jgi:hypothetical protein
MAKHRDIPVGELAAAIERLRRSRPKKTKGLGRPFYSPVGGTLMMRVGIEDAWLIREAAKARGQTVAQVIRSRDW